MYIRAYITGPQFPAGIGKSQNSGSIHRDPYTDPPCTLAEGGNFTTTGCTTTPRPRPRTATFQDQNHRRNWQCVNVSLQFQKITTPYSLFFFFRGRGDRGEGESQSSPDSYFRRHLVYALSDKTQRRPDRVIACLKYVKQTHKKNLTDIFHHLPNT
jgi:hypothetical protein